MRPLKILKTFRDHGPRLEKPQSIEVPVKSHSQHQSRGPGAHQTAKDEEPPSCTSSTFQRRAARHASRLRIGCTRVFAGKSQREQTREVITRLANRAYRRPATKDEIEALAKFVDQAVADGQKWEAAWRLAVTAVLCLAEVLVPRRARQSPHSTERTRSTISNSPRGTVTSSGAACPTTSCSRWLNKTA